MRRPYLQRIAQPLDPRSAALSPSRRWPVRADEKRPPAPPHPNMEPPHPAAAQPIAPPTAAAIQSTAIKPAAPFVTPTQPSAEPLNPTTSLSGPITRVSKASEPRRELPRSASDRATAAEPRPAPASQRLDQPTAPMPNASEASSTAAPFTGDVSQTARADFPPQRPGGRPTIVGREQHFEADLPASPPSPAARTVHPTALPAQPQPEMPPVAIAPPSPSSAAPPAVVNALPRGPAQSAPLPAVIPSRMKSADAQGPAVRIGSIEVHVAPPAPVPPPTPAPRTPAAAPAAAPALSRSLTTAFGLRQG